MNKSQAEKKVYAFHAVFRVDVNDVKPFQNPTKTSPFDHFLDPQDFLKQYTDGWFKLCFYWPCFSSLLRESGWLRAYQNDYVIDKYVEPAVIWRIHTSPMDKYHLH